METTLKFYKTWFSRKTFQNGRKREEMTKMEQVHENFRREADATKHPRSKRSKLSNSREANANIQNCS